MNSFLHFWQYLPYKMSPVLLKIGSFQIRYYSLMYILAFTTVYFLALREIKKKELDFSPQLLEDYIFNAIIGVLIGGRLGYVLFYNLSYYLGRPWEILLPFSFENGFHFTGISGMSYHGGTLGAIIATILFCKFRKVNFWKFTDLITPYAALGYTFGRIGNFINGELYGRITQSAWGMYFPLDNSGHLRHPSQLYEAFFEGLVLFFVLKFLSRFSFAKRKLIAFYIMGYGIVRFFIEYFREPDAHLGFVLMSFSMGQVLCFAMILVGIAVFFIAKKLDKGLF